LSWSTTTSTKEKIAKPELGSDQAEEARDEGGEEASAEEDHGSLESVEASIDAREPVVHPAFERVEALVDVGGEVVQPCICPTLSHRLHDCS
jgi:hypothetical protein